MSMAICLAFEIENELDKNVRGEVRFASAVWSLSGCLKGGNVYMEGKHTGRGHLKL